jgi:16S rRNA (guanine527-N7)-methyltransferase
VRKKADALGEIVRRLELPVSVAAARAEAVLAQRRFDLLVARAVGPLWKLLSWLAPHWDAFDQLLLIKGPRWVDERLEARHRGQLRRLELRRLAEYSTPGHSGQNVILSLTRKSKASGGD